jgi:hypothetical protein
MNTAAQTSTETSAANSAAAMNPQLKALVLGNGDSYHMRKLQPLSGDHGDVVAMQAGLIELFSSAVNGTGFGSMDMSLGLYANDTTRDPVQRMVARSVDIPLEVMQELDELDQLDLLYAWIEVNDRFFAQTLPKLMMTLAGMMTKLASTTKAMQSMQQMKNPSTGSASLKR